MCPKQTPLYEFHLRAKAQMVDFAGWEMPLQYTGILEEHKAVREHAGLFDVSHMGRIEVEGGEAVDFLQRVLTNDVTRLEQGQALYALMCLPDGGTIDDLVVYRTGEHRFLLVVNAANTAKDLEWLRENGRTYQADIRDVTDSVAQLAIQGPLAASILQSATDAPLADLPSYNFLEGKVDGIPCLISRTGYTGEDGFELYVSAEAVQRVWESLSRAGEPQGLKPVGLGARDTLRLEAGLPLYGNELSEAISPLEAGLERFVRFAKGDFIGKEALLRQREGGLERKRIGFSLLDKGIARKGYAVTKDGREIGRVTSGAFAPALGQAVGMALVGREAWQVGTEIEIIIRGRGVRARTVPVPFYKRG